MKKNLSCTIHSTFITQFKVSVIGCGNVGATTAYAMLIDGTPTELVLIDRKKEKAEGLSLDFEHSLPFYDYTKITATDDVSAVKNSQLIVVTAGGARRGGGGGGGAPPPKQRPPAPAPPNPPHPP